MGDASPPQNPAQLPSSAVAVLATNSVEGETQSLVLEDRVVVRGGFWNRLDDVPMFHNLAVFQPEDINDGVARVANQAYPMAVQNDEIAVCKRALDFAMRIRMIVANPLGELAKSLLAVFDEQVVLPVVFATV